MHYKPLLLLLHLVVGITGYAQHNNGADSIANYSIGGPIIGYDTVQAVRQLFAARRDDARYTANVGMLTIGVGGVVLIPIFSLVNAIGTAVGVQPDPGRMVVLGLKLTSPGLLATAFGVARRIRHNRKREEALLLAYQRGQPLPPALLRSLNRRYRRLNR